MYFSDARSWLRPEISGAIQAGSCQKKILNPGAKHRWRQHVWAAKAHLCRLSGSAQPQLATTHFCRLSERAQPQLRSSATSNGEQRVRVLVPNAQGLQRTTQFLMQDYLNLVDWKGLELPSTERRCKSKCQEIRTLPNGEGRVD